MSIVLTDIETPVQFLVPRNGKDQPMVVPKAGGKPAALTRTTTFIDCIEDKTTLANWGKRMVLLGVAAKPSLIEDVLAVDLNAERHRDHLMALVEKALQAAGANEKRDKGTYLHGLTELVDQDKPLPDNVAEVDLIDMAVYRMETLIRDVTFSSVEQFVVCEQLKVGGTPDRICHYSGPGPDGEHIEGDFIWDLKTGTVDYGGLKMASQLAIYSRAETYDPTLFPAPPYARTVKKSEDPEGFERFKAWRAWLDTEFDAELAASAYSPLRPVNQDLGIIFNLPAGSGRAGLLWADLNVGWRAAELATTIREMRTLSGKSLKPFAPFAA